MQAQISDEIEALLEILPPDSAQKLRELDRVEDLLEVILDLGRPPEARFVDEEVILSPREITQEDLDEVVSRLGPFTGDNRAGIRRTLHRISCIRNRQGHIVGLTCRIGRAVYGTIDIIRDIVESGRNILLLGRPGVGKTTMLREVARVLAEGKRVVIVDTSNEIGGDGDIPHPAIGRARRMQVPAPEMQHKVMIEAVENHMPEVIVIDEIGTELEAAAARTIAERGVQLIGTAHGNILDNLMLNPTLADLVGGIQVVTLSDEEARRRGTQKSILERKAPPTFQVVVEIMNREQLAVHHDVAEAVDAILRGRSLPAEIRYREVGGKFRIEQGLPSRFREEERPFAPQPLPGAPQRTLNIYPYGASHNRLEQAIRQLGVPANVVKNLTEADALITLRSYYRRRGQAIEEAERRGIPVYVLRNNTTSQMEGCLTDIFRLRPRQQDPFAQAVEETQAAIRRVLAGSELEELDPQNSYVRRRQHQLAKEANLISRSIGQEPLRRVRVYRDRAVANRE